MIWMNGMDCGFVIRISLTMVGEAGQRKAPKKMVGGVTRNAEKEPVKKSVASACDRQAVRKKCCEMEKSHLESAGKTAPHPLTILLRI